jgi:hypothetical protein
MSALHHVSNRPILSSIVPDQTKDRESDTSTLHRRPPRAIAIFFFLKVTLATGLTSFSQATKKKQKFDLLRFSCLWGDCAGGASSCPSLETTYLRLSYIYRCHLRKVYRSWEHLVSAARRWVMTLRTVVVILDSGLYSPMSAPIYLTSIFFENESRDPVS